MTAHPEDWELLGVEPDTDLVLVKRAFMERRALYESNTLATYNLLDDDEREEMVTRIETAYERIVGDAPQAMPAEAPTPAPIQQPEVPTGPAPDLAAEPGELLHHTRLRLGLSLHQIAIETKIGVQILEQIENEDFEALPATVFVRGHVQQFARELKLPDPGKIAQHYIEKMEGGEDEG